MALQSLIFVRHGQSRHHVDGLTGGWTDTPLTGLGRQQIARAAQYLVSQSLPDDVGCYCSDLKRAHESAVIIGERLGRAFVVLRGLREINNGDAAGMTEAAAQRIAAQQPSQSDVDWRPYANAETFREMSDRVARTLSEIAGRGTQRAVIVGHGLSGIALIRAWLGIPLELPLSFELDTASVTQLSVNRWGEPQIDRLNWTIT